MAEIHVVFPCYKYASQPDQQVNGEDTHTHTPLAGEMQRGIWRDAESRDLDLLDLERGEGGRGRGSE